MNKTVLFTYDTAGNITERCEYAYTSKMGEELSELVCTHFGYDYEGDRLVSYNGESVAYNVLGNPTSYRGNATEWQYGNRLTKYGTTTFAYDGAGRRVSKGNISFTYDSNGRLIKQSNGLEFIYDNSGVIGLKYGENTYFYRRDCQGNIIALIDNNGAVVVEYKYDAWGNHEAEVASEDYVTLANLNPFRYRGYYYDSETDLYFLQTRYYDPEVVRFISRDSIEYADPETICGLNLYAYCGNNPVMNVDPMGNAWWDWLAGALAIVGIALVVAAVTVVTCGVGTALAGTMAGAIVYGAAQGVLVGAAIGVVSGGIIGGAVSGWTAEGILVGMGIGLGAGAIIGGVIGGFVGAGSFTANSAYITKYGGNVKEVLSAFKGNPKLKTLKWDTTVYRTWGGSSPEYGHWITPKNYGSAARSMLSLPAGNSASNTSTFLITKGSSVLKGKAAALFGQAGGGIQWWIGLL